MDIYMRSVGFAVSRYFEDKKRIESAVVESPDRRVVFGHGEKEICVEYYKMFGNGIGILARGTMDDGETVLIDSYEPFAISDYDLEVNKYIVEYADGQPVIVFEDIGTGNELVFKLHNKIDFYKDEKFFIVFGRSVEYSKTEGIIKRKINLTAMSVYGTVILPVYKAPFPAGGAYDDEYYLKSLILRFKEGDDEAGEILNLYAEETSRTLGERLKEEDLLSVVEGYFLPMEENETEYSVLGEIMEVSRTRNLFTGDEILKLTLNVAGSKIQLFINSKDIVGCPMPEMRFMGVCRLMGSVII